VSGKIKVAQFGLGPIGIETLKLASSKPWAEVVGGVDIDPAKVGRDLSEITGLGILRGRSIYPSIDELLAEVKPQLIFHTAVSKFKAAYPQLEAIARRGINVVSSCEELVFPALREPKLAVKLNRVCRSSGARIVGTGVNPGFVMDVLPLCFSMVSLEVRAVHAERVVDASTRREPLQRKIGSGMRPAEFRSLLRAGRAGHAGLKESLALLAHGLGWNLKNIVETGDAIIASRNIRTRYLQVRKGQTCGLHQRAQGQVNGRIRLTLDLKMFLGAKDPHDAIQIEGDPPLKIIIHGGVAGDQATVAALVNTAPRLLRARPGLLLPTDLPLPSFS
jgi:4-hydroxy-tetrahydrodipicolinate reductase